MKKLLTILLAVTLLSVTAIPSLAQGRDYRRNENEQRYSRDYNDQRYRDRGFWERHRDFDRHRDKVTIAGGTVAGALLGAIIGGRKGALIGAAAGAGSSALYTYKLRQNHHRRF